MRISNPGFVPSPSPATPAASRGVEDVRAEGTDSQGKAPRRDSVEISALSDDPSTDSAIDTPLWDSIQKVTGALVPGAQMVPFMIVGATDARFFRRAGATAYGAGLFSDKIPFAEFMSMFHGNDERIDQESLRLSAELWMGVAKDLLA